MKFINKVVILFVFLILSANILKAQAPLLKCLAVDTLGNVQISWGQPLDTCTFFTQYDIYYSTNNAGPYSLVGSISDFLTTNYYHMGANADVGSCYYYVSAVSGCPNNISDTLKTIFLVVNNTVQGITDLNWNDTYNPLVPTSTGMYFIYRENNAMGSMQLIDSVFHLNQFVDSFTVCNDTIDYQIVMFDSSGCVSASNVVPLYPDGLQPGIVIIDSVSIDNITGFGTIGWQRGTASDIMGYIIYVANDFGGWDSINTVYGADNTFYLDILSAIDTDAVVYNIVAIDSCNNKGVFGDGHTTMILEGTLDTCLGEALLSWNEYYLWPAGVTDYDIYVSENGAPYSLLGSSSSTQFVHTGIVRGSTYCYFVRANEGTGIITASSNIICSYKNMVASDNISLVLAAEARDSIKNILYWNEDPLWINLIDGYYVYRSFDDGGYSLVGFQSFGIGSYTDSLLPLDDFSSGKGEFCYYIVPKKASVDLYGCIDTSNIECVTQYPKFVVPNTFTPNGDGINDIFLPIKVFVAHENYLFIIYNRWGQKIFETTDPEEGWDGKLKGSKVQNDAYVYYVSFRIRGDEQVIKAGTVMALR